MTCHPEGVRMTRHPQGVRMTRHPQGADDTSSARGDDTSSARGADDIFSMIEYIKSTRDDVWMTLALSVREEDIKDHCR